MAPSLLYVVASVELKGKHKIKMKTLNVKELNGKHKKKRGKHNIKPLNPSFKKKQKPQLLGGADAWLPSSPGLEVLLPGHPTAASAWQVLTRGCLLVPIGVTNRDERSSCLGAPQRPRGAPFVPVRNSTGTKSGGL